MLTLSNQCLTDLRHRDAEHGERAKFLHDMRWISDRGNASDFRRGSTSRVVGRGLCVNVRVFEICD
jgi:hypothetical protein